MPWEIPYGFFVIKANLVKTVRNNRFNESF